MSVKSVFIVWYSYSRRAETLATELNAQVIFQYEKKLKGLWLTPLRYIVQGWKTWRFLEREQPGLVFVQSPPIFAPLAVALWCKLRGKIGPSGRQVPYVIDCHPGTFYDSMWRLALPLLRWLSRRAVVTLLCNEAAQDILQAWRVRNIFLPDGPPVLCDTSSTIGTDGEARVAVISTFNDVEPIAEVFGAARLLPRVTFYVTGDPERASAGLLAQKPENAILTGFLRGADYVGLLKNVQGLVILTKQPYDLSCGAYEALSVAKPAVISDWPGSRRSFRRGFIYVNNTPEAIADGVSKLLQDQEMLTIEVIAMHSELINSRQPKLKQLAALIT